MRSYGEGVKHNDVLRKDLSVLVQLNKDPESN